MKKNQKKLLIISALITIILIGGYAVYRTYLHPEVLMQRLSQTLSEKTQKKINITGIHIDSWSRPVVYLKDFELGDKNSIYIKCPQVEAKISAWYLLRGKLKPKNISLKNPLIIVHPDKLTQNKTNTEFPLLNTSGAQLKLVFSDKILVFENMEGTITPKRLNLDADMLQGKIKITALKIGKTWNGALIANDLNLQNTKKTTTGTADVKLLFRSDLSEYSAVLSASGANILLPWGAHLAQAKMSMLISGNKNTATMSRIDFDCPIFAVQGTINCTQLGGPEPIKCEANMQTNAFEYNAFINLLPVKHFSKTLRILLTQNVRGGVFQAKTIQYSGKLSELKDVKTCLRNLYIEGEHSGQSYTALPGYNRVKNISGTARANKGTLEFTHINGTMGKSTIKEVELVFPNIARKGFQTDVRVDIDMQADDFLDTWRASVTSEKLTALLNPVNRITNGKISGLVSVHYDDQKRESYIKGGIEISDASFFWGDKKIDHMNAHGNAADYLAPALINASLLWDGKPIDTIQIDLDDPLGEKNFTYTLQAREIIASKNFSLNKKASYILNGKGTWPEYSGQLNITTRDLHAFGYRLQPKKGGITAQAEVSGSIAPHVNINIPNMAITTDANRLLTHIYLGEDKSLYQLSGLIHLKELLYLKNNSTYELDGDVIGDITIENTGKTDSQGSLELKGVQLPFGEKKSSLYGELTFLGDKITTSSLTITRENMHAKLSGSLRMGDTPFYSGKIAADGITLQSSVKASDFWNDLKKIEGSAHIALSNLNINGLAIATGTADADLQAGTLSLKDMLLKSPYGELKGMLNLSSDKKTIFDVNVDINDTPVETIHQAISDGPVWMKGNINAHGRLWGSNENINGDIKYEAFKGRILRYSLISRIFSVLNPYKMIKSREIDLSSKGFPYNTISADFKIRDSQINYDNFYLDSNSLQISALGKYLINEHHIDAILGVQPLETMDKTLCMIPVVGWVLTGERGMLLVVSLKVRGPLDAPSVKLLSADTLSKPAAQALLRILKLPVDVMTKPGSVFLPNLQQKEKSRECP